MIKTILSFFIFFLLSTKVYSTNVAVIDVNYIINNSYQFIEITKKINDSQIEIKNKFINIENDLIQKKNELEDLKLILNENEFNLKKIKYYEEVSNFENEVSNFNSHYENEIANIKNLLYSKIAELIQNYSIENQYDLILEKNQYLIVSDKLNITDVIFVKLNNLKIDLKFSKYES